MTIDAYDDVPTIFHTYNPPYYHSYIKNAGFRTECGVVQYQISFTPELAERYRGMVERAEKSGVSLRTWDFDRLEAENELFTELFNETFADHFGFMPLPAAVMSGLTVGLKDFLVRRLHAFRRSRGSYCRFRLFLAGLEPGFPSDERQGHRGKLCRVSATPLDHRSRRAFDNRRKEKPKGAWRQSGARRAQLSGDD